jgi:hypothetical protein
MPRARTHPAARPRTEAETARNTLAATIRRGDPGAVTQARRDLAEIVLADQIAAARERVAAWPAFTDDQIARLTLLLRGDGAA